MSGLKGKRLRLAEDEKPKPLSTKSPNRRVAKTFNQPRTASRGGGSGSVKAEAHKTVEELEPEKAAHVVEALAEGGRISQVLKEAGFPGASGRALLDRLRRRYLPVHMEVKKLKTNELIEAIDEKLAMVLDYIDPVVLEAASASQLGVLFGILSDKRQLLRGEPTQILSVVEREKLDDLVPALMQEAKRRGQDLELVEDEDGNWIPAGLTPVPYHLNKSTGGFRDRNAARRTPEK